MPLSAVINTKNAAQTLKKTLESVKFADEIVVVDMHSSDDTVKIAKKYTNKIFTYKDVGFVEPARKFAVSKAKNKWVLIIDADEQIPIKLAKKIKDLIKNDQPYNGFYLARKNIIWQQWIKHTGWWPDYQLRLFKKNKIEFSNKIHQPPQVSGQTLYLPTDENLAILHHNYPSVSNYLQRLNRYTTHEAKKNKDQNISASQLLNDFFADFFNRYFYQQGYKDDIAGTALSFGQASYQMFALLKTWENQNYANNKESFKIKQQTWQTIQKHLAYYLADWQVKNTKGLKKLYWRVVRKLKS